MIALLWLLWSILASPIKSKCQLEAENVLLRHQVIVLRRQMRGRVRLRNLDRLVLVQLYRWFPSILRVLAIVPLAAGAAASWGIILTPAFGAALMSLSTVIVAINAKLLERARGLVASSNVPVK